MAVKTRPQFPKTIDARVLSGGMERMSPADREQIEEMVELLAGVLRLRRNDALDLLLRCAWAKMDRLDIAADLCTRLNGGGGADAETKYIEEAAVRRLQVRNVGQDLLV